MAAPNGGRGLPARNNGPAASVDRFFELSLLGLVASGYFAVVGSGYLDFPTSLLTALALGLRALIVTGILRLEISNRAVAALTLAYIAFYPIDYAFISREFLTATVHLVFFLAVLKILTARSTRDHVFVAVIAFLELLAASVLSSNVTFFVFLALFMIFGVATFASGEIRRSIRRPRHIARGGLRRFYWRLAGLAAGISFGILVLTGGMFFLLPRTARAAFQHLVPERYHIPGFSNEMRLGEIGEIQQRSTPVMHARLFDDVGAAHYKWRGNALSHFDGRRWFNPPEAGQILKATDGLLPVATDDQRRRTGRRIRYEVRLHSLTSDALFFAGTPEFLRIEEPVMTVIRGANNGYRLGYGLGGRLQYGAVAFVEETAVRDDPYVAPLPESERVANLLLPQVDPRIMDLARRLTAGIDSPAGKARAIENHLKTRYGYTLELLPSSVEDPLANFLFERRKGHCEYFSSAMAVMLRIVNVPARIANGFQSGSYNPVSGWHVVRASDAHSWVEAYIPGRGWTTFDPTPPSRGESGFAAWNRLIMYLDAAETFWQDWVLNYNLDRQLILASRMETSGRTFSLRWVENLRATASAWKRGALAGAKLYGPLVASALIAAILAWFFTPRIWRWVNAIRRVRSAQRGTALASDATLLYERMLRVLRRRGFEKPRWTTPVEFARQLPAPAGELVTNFTAAYNDLRFGGNSAAAPRMVALLEQMERG